MKHILTFFTFLLFATVTFGQTSVMPIVSGGVVVGGVQNGKWLTAKQMIPLLKNNLDLFLISQKGLQKTVIRAKKGEDADFCDETRMIDFGKEIYSIAVGSNISWNPFPRNPKVVAKTDKTYQKIVADFLKTKRIINPKIKITQIFRIDLDGDGTEEVLITANHYRRGDYESPSAGDYSFALLRKIVNGKPNNFLIDGEFFPKRDNSTIPTNLEVDLIADLNGDGKMEVWLDGSYYEGNSSLIYELNKDRLTKVLEMGCGV
jgi:hypothetical protein